MTAPMTWEIRPVAGGLGAHKDAWHALHAALCPQEPWLSARSVDVLVRHAPAAGTVLATGLDAQGQPRAMCLLQPQPGGWATFLPPGAPLGTQLLPADADPRTLLLSLPGAPARLTLRGLDPALSGDAILSHPRVSVASHAMVASADLRSGREAYWAARPECRAPQGPAPRCEVLDDAAAMADALCRAAAAGAWPGVAVLVADLVAAWAAEGQARVLLLWQGETLSAVQPLLVQGDQLVALEAWQATTTDTAVLDPWLRWQLVEHAFQASPGGRLAWHGQAARAALAWASERHHTLHVQVERKEASLLARALSLVQAGTRIQGGRVSVDMHEGLHALPDDVRALFAVGEACRMSQGADWLHLLAGSALEADAVVRVHVLRSNGRPLAALPTLSYRGSGRVEALSNYYTVMYSPAFEPGLDNTALVPLVHALRRGPDAPAMLQFGPMDPLGPGFAMLRTSLQRAGMATFAYFAHGNWYLPVVSTWPAYYEGRPGTVRNNVKRMGRKLEAAGGRLEILSRPEDADAAISAYEHVYARSWKQAEPHPAFMPGLIRLCARRGWLRMGIAWLGEQPIAAQLWIVVNERAEIYKIAYDEAHKAITPGTLVTTLLMQHAFEVDRVREVDYLIGDDPYKAQWMTHRRERLGLVAYNLRSVRGLLLAARELAARTLKRLRKERAPA